MMFTLTAFFLDRGTKSSTTFLPPRAKVSENESSKEQKFHK